MYRFFAGAAAIALAACLAAPAQAAFPGAFDSFTGAFRRRKQRIR